MLIQGLNHLSCLHAKEAVLMAGRDELMLTGDCTERPEVDMDVVSGILALTTSREFKCSESAVSLSIPNYLELSQAVRRIPYLRAAMESRGGCSWNY